MARAVCRLIVTTGDPADMTQNIYDDSTFFEGYGQLGRSADGLAGAVEWHAIQAMLPDMRSLKVVDLGCGFGWFCDKAEALEQPVGVIGVDDGGAAGQGAFTSGDLVSTFALALALAGNPSGSNLLPVSQRPENFIFRFPPPQHSAPNPQHLAIRFAKLRLKKVVIAGGADFGGRRPSQYRFPSAGHEWCARHSPVSEVADFETSACCLADRRRPASQSYRRQRSTTP